MGLLDRIRRNRDWRIDVAKAAVLRELAAIDEARDAEPLRYVAEGTPEWIAEVERRAAQWQHKMGLHTLLEDDEALLVYHDRKAGTLSESTAGGGLSEVER